MGGLGNLMALMKQRTGNGGVAGGGMARPEISSGGGGMIAPMVGGMAPPRMNSGMAPNPGMGASMPFKPQFGGTGRMGSRVGPRPTRQMQNGRGRMGMF